MTLVIIFSVLDLSWWEVRTSNPGGLKDPVVQFDLARDL
jgi:hypothetical protein